MQVFQPLFCPSLFGTVISTSTVQSIKLRHSETDTNLYFIQEIRSHLTARAVCFNQIHQANVVLKCNCCLLYELRGTHRHTVRRQNFVICRSAKNQSQLTSDGRFVSRSTFETSLVAQTRTENLWATPIPISGQWSGRRIAGPWWCGRGQRRTAGKGSVDGQRA